MGDAYESDCNVISYLQIYGVSRADENVKLFPIPSQDQADLRSVPVGLRFSLAPRCLKSLMRGLESERDSVPVDGAALGPDLFADEVVTSRSTPKDPDTAKSFRRVFRKQPV